VVVLDRGLRVMGCNQAARQLLGLTRRAGEYLALEEIFEGPHLAGAQAALDQALGAGRPSPGQEARLRDAQGREFACRYWVDPLFGPARQVQGAILTLQDLEFNPLAPDRLDPAESLPQMPRLGYQALFENLAEGIFTINTRWRITSFNQSAEQITGYRREEVLGRFCWDIFRSDLCQTGCPLKTTLETGLTRMDQDVRMLSKDGRRITVLINTNVVKDPSGQVVGAVESFRLLNGSENGLETAAAGQSFSDIIGTSPPMRRLFQMLPDVAASQASVLITGESGTGKELVARAIHHHSPRREGPFVAVNCSALAESLLESELFGHEKAAFTGAVRSRVGRFELARGGTLFLDEIGDLKPELQIKLLRVLEEKVFERVGGTRLIPLEARIIAATNRDLDQALKDGSFRQDLYYRLRTVPISLPPLRQRRQDIPLLVQHFIERLNKTTGKEVRAVDPKVMKIFMEYRWPGNVRELERIMEHAFVFVKGPVIFTSNLPALEELMGRTAPLETAPRLGPDQDEHSARQAVLQALEACGGRRGEAARLLGISRTSLWRRMKALGLTEGSGSRSGS